MKTPEGYADRLFRDMLAQPHLMIGGATGSGKSVVINGLIFNALFDFPGEKKLILIDPKRVELSLEDYAALYKVRLRTEGYY